VIPNGAKEAVVVLVFASGFKNSDQKTRVEIVQNVYTPKN
jgi:hypothetical protein